MRWSVRPLLVSGTASASDMPTTINNLCDPPYCDNYDYIEFRIAAAHQEGGGYQASSAMSY